MSRLLIQLIASYFLLSAVLMWSLPQLWYETVPGVVQTGGFNAHFIRDIALAMAVSAVALWLGLRQRQGLLMLFGAGWPLLHALFHIWIWLAHRGATLDLIALTNLLGIQLPAWLAIGATVQVQQQEAAA